MTSPVAAGVSDLQREADAALQRRDPVAALAVLDRAAAKGRRDAPLLLSRALALRMTGRFAEAIEALDEVLVERPYDFVAHLSKGALLERLDRPRDAAAAYRIAVDIAPAADALPPGLIAPLVRAREVLREQAEALAARLTTDLAPIRARWPEANLDRFDEGLAIYSGMAEPRPSDTPFPQRSVQLPYPGLPAVPFWDRDLFPWLPDLEAATPTIQRELDGVRRLKADQFAPYIAYPPGAPVNQWGELNHSRRWSSLFLWKDGVRQDAIWDACPETAALLDRLPMARQPGYAPTAMFSALDSRTRIPPHTGSANTRLIVHLPLVLPGPSRFRVGPETRDWRMGEAWVFDDTIEHEAWNDADDTRVILIFDVWNPLLSDAERDLISAMMTARNVWAAEA